jgi:hypothetical protein
MRARPGTLPCHRRHSAMLAVNMPVVSVPNRCFHEGPAKWPPPITRITCSFRKQFYARRRHAQVDNSGPMLRRAIIGHHHHRLCTAYSQCLSHATATVLSCPTQPDLKNLTTPTRRPFSNSLVIRQREDDSEASSRQTDSSSFSGTLGGPSSRSNPQLREQAHDHDGPFVTDLEECSTNADNILHAADHTSRAQAGNSRTRSRTLRPLLIPPSFPPDLLLPTTSTPASDSPPPSSLSSSSSLYQGEKTRSAEMHTDASSSTSTIQLTDLPPRTFKTDIRPVFQHYGEIKRIIVQPDGRSAAVVFADAVAVRRVLHAYADQPLRVRGQEIVVSRERSAHRGPDVKVVAPRGTPRARDEKKDDGEGNSAIFVSNFPAGTTQEVLLRVLAPLGKYEGIVMRTRFTSSFFSLLGVQFVFLSQFLQVLVRNTRT